MGQKLDKGDLVTKRIDRLFCILICCLVVTTMAEANNGLNRIGYGVESITMGGADVAVARDTSALNTNPAGLIQISSKEMDLNLGMAYALDVKHQDSLGNDARVGNSPFGWGEVAYAQSLRPQSVTIGIGVFAQGGVGSVYHDVITPFGTRDELSSLFRIAKLDMGAALQVKSNFTVGMSLAVFYADLNQRIFPDTSFYNTVAPALSFYGIEVDRAQAIKFGYKFGAMWNTTDWLKMGLTYTGKINLDMNGGRFISNLTAIGLGKVTYNDVRMSGLNLPQEVGLGVAAWAGSKLLIASEIKWINWSSALTTSTLTATNPDNSAAPSVQSFSSEMNWRDQTVLAIGLAYRVTNNLLFRAGYNYGRNPVPDSTLNPLLPAISEQTITSGAGYSIGKRWSIDAGLEYLPKKVIRYTNPSSPFGPNAQEVSEVIALHFRIIHLM